MTKRLAATPLLNARLVGVLYVVMITAGVLAQNVVRPALVVRSDAAASAARIMESESLYRLGGAADLLLFAANVAVAALFYRLLAPAGRDLALLAAFFRLTFAAVAGANAVNHFAPLRLLGGDSSLAAFTPAQLQALAHLFARLQSTGHAVAIVFYGVSCLLTGYLVFRSTFLPRFLGVLLALGGIGYVVNSFAGFLSPPLASSLFPAILVPAGIAEVSLCLWLLVKGVNAQRWKELADATGTPTPLPPAAALELSAALPAR